MTREQEQLNVDFYVKWRIDELRKYYEATGGTEEVANLRLGETIKRQRSRASVTQRTLQQVVTAERAEFTDATMMKNARPAAKLLGSRVWSMCASPRSICRSRCEIRCTSACGRSFKAQAAKLRAEGIETSERIRAEANKQQTQILGRCGAASGADRAARAMPPRARCMQSRTRRTRSSTASTAACSHIVKSTRNSGRCIGDCARQRLFQIFQAAPICSTQRARPTLMTMEIGWGKLARYLGGAFALYLVLEGVLPFSEPSGSAAADGQTVADRRQTAALGRLDQHDGGIGTAVGGAQWVRISSSLGLQWGDEGKGKVVFGEQDLHAANLTSGPQGGN